MAVVVETTLGDITIDLYIEERPTTCMNFLKLCKIKYYNFCLFHSVQQNFIAQTGDPSGSGHGGSSVFHYTQGNSSNYYEAEKLPKIKHNNIGTVSMVNCGNNMLGSQFFITLGKDLQSLDGEHCVFGEVTEGHEILRKFNEVICDQGHRPYQDIRITHTVILEDPFDDPPGLKVPDSSPELTKEVLANSRIAPDEEIDETAGLTAEEVEEMQRKREAQAQATILEIVGDLPDADIAPPENVLFVCKLNPVTTDDDLEIIFSRFGKIVSCEVIRDKNTGDSLQYAFVEFDNRKACEDAYFKMDNVLIDDRRIHVDFSQSVSKLRWKGKGRLEHLDDGKPRPDYANYDRKHDGKVGRSSESSRQRYGESDSRTHNRVPNRRENDRSSKVSQENNSLRHDSRNERSNERHTRVYSDLGRDRYHRPRESHDSRERYRSEVDRENSYRYKQKYNERERYRNERRKDVYFREDKYKKKSKSESSDSDEKVSTNEDKYNKGTRRKLHHAVDYEKLNYREKEGIKEKCDDGVHNVEVKNVSRVKKNTRKSSSSSETEDESVSSSDDETKREGERSFSKIKQQEISSDVTKTRDKIHGKRSPSEEVIPQHSVTKYENRKRKDSGSDEEKHITIEDKVNKRKVRHDHENKCGKLKKEEKLRKIKSTSNCSNEKTQTQEKHKHNRNREVIIGSGSEDVREISHHQEKRKNRRNRSDSHESDEKSPSVRNAGNNNKKRERNNSTSTEHRSSSCKHRGVTRDDSDSDEHVHVKKSSSVRNKRDSPRHSKKNAIKTKNKKLKPMKKREIVRKKKKRRDKRNKSSSSSRTSDSETVSSSSTSSSSSSSSTSSSSSSGSESSDSSSSSSSSTSSSSSDDNRRLKRRKKISKTSVVKKPKRGTCPVKKTKKVRRKLSDVSGEDSRKTKGKEQKKKSEMVGRNNIEKRVKVKSPSKRKRVSHSSDSSSESESSEDSIRDSRKRKKIRK